MSRRRRGRQKKNDDVLSFIVLVMMIIFLMPVAGLYFLLRKDPSKRWLGWVLFIVGTILWIAIL